MAKKINYHSFIKMVEKNHLVEEWFATGVAIACTEKCASNCDIANVGRYVNCAAPWRAGREFIEKKLGVIVIDD